MNTTIVEGAILKLISDEVVGHGLAAVFRHDALFIHLRLPFTVVGIKWNELFPVV